MMTNTTNANFSFPRKLTIDLVALKEQCNIQVPHDLEIITLPHPVIPGETFEALKEVYHAPKEMDHPLSIYIMDDSVRHGHYNIRKTW